jgi:dTDP-4-dehydrorhamnose 3,5-epimerase
VAAPVDIEDAGIAGVFLVPLTTHHDVRGSFTEIYRRDFVPGMQEMVQANLSFSHAGVLRGLHVHRHQADYWTVVSGTALVGLYDLRAGSPTAGQKAEIRLEGGEPRTCLYISKGVAHGFYAETDVVLQYLVDEYFTGEDEFGVAWDDQDVGIDWPTGGREPILSQRDQGNLSLAEMLEDPPPYEP